MHTANGNNTHKPTRSVAVHVCPFRTFPPDACIACSGSSLPSNVSFHFHTYLPTTCIPVSSGTGISTHKSTHPLTYLSTFTIFIPATQLPVHSGNGIPTHKSTHSLTIPVQHRTSQISTYLFTQVIVQPP